MKDAVKVWDTGLIENYKTESLKNPHRRFICLINY